MGSALFFPGPRESLLRSTLNVTLLDGQSRRWAPLVFFVRWWHIAVSSVGVSGVDTNRAPYDYWLSSSSVFFSSLF